MPNGAPLLKCSMAALGMIESKRDNQAMDLLANPNRACRCPQGDSIDLYHIMSFDNNGVSPFFYGGNYLPHDFLFNPVPK